jgi:hypothetical protein
MSADTAILTISLVDHASAAPLQPRAVLAAHSTQQDHAVAPPPSLYARSPRASAPALRLEIASRSRHDARKSAAAIFSVEQIAAAFGLQQAAQRGAVPAWQLRRLCGRHGIAALHMKVVRRCDKGIDSCCCHVGSCSDAPNIAHLALLRKHYFAWAAA